MPASSSFNVFTLKQDLARGISFLALDVDEDKQNQMLAFLRMLVKWNQAYNLSGIKDPKKMLSLHLLDSLSILPYVRGRKILDVGTGAGLPGIPLAICLPESQFSLLDSNGKKMRFVFQSSSSLKLKNIDIIQQRVESYQSRGAFDIVLSRAFSTLKQMVERTAHLLAPEGRLLSMKGQLPQKEINEIPEGFRLLDVHELRLPGETTTRHLLELGRQ